MQVGFGGGESFGYKRQTSLHILKLFQITYSMKGFPTFFPTLTKIPCAWILEAIAGSPPMNSRLLQHWHMDPGSDSGTAPACQQTQGWAL